MNTRLQQRLELALFRHLPLEVPVGSVVALNDDVHARVIKVMVVRGVRVVVVSVLNGSVADLVKVLKAGRVVMHVNNVVMVVDVRVVDDPAVVESVGQPDVKVVVDLEVVHDVDGDSVNLSKEGSSWEVPNPA